MPDRRASAKSCEACLDMPVFSLSSLKLVVHTAKEPMMESLFMF